MNAFHALADIGLKEVVMRNAASALSALFVTVQIFSFPHRRLPPSAWISRRSVVIWP